jgi:Holliday junction resolvase-like predicted endonuclease
MHKDNEKIRINVKDRNLYNDKQMFSDGSKLNKSKHRKLCRTISIYLKASNMDSEVQLKPKISERKMAARRDSYL